MVVRAGEAPFLFSLGKGTEVFLAAPDRRRPVPPLIVVYQPGAKTSHWSAHDGDEFMYLLEGQLCVEFRASEAVVLNPGDAISSSQASAPTDWPPSATPRRASSSSPRSVFPPRHAFGPTSHSTLANWISSLATSRPSSNDA
jgi:hypothetical protein